MRQHPSNPHITMLEKGGEITQTVAAYSSVGSYPLLYLDTRDNVLCPACVEADLEVACDPEDPGRIVACSANWEDASLYCDSCSERIESAYAEDDVEGGES